MKSKFRYAAKRSSRTHRIAGLCCLALAGPLSAANGTWTATAGGDWGQSSNWSAGTIADGSGSIADFSTLDPTADVEVTLDMERTIGQLKFGDTAAATEAGWLLSGTASLVLAGTPEITVGALAAGKAAEISLPLDSAAGFTKRGAGKLLLTGVNEWLNGTISIVATGGTVAIDSEGALGTAGVNMPDTANPTCGFELIGDADDINLGNPVRIAGAGPSSTGALRNVAGDNSLSNFGFSHSSAGGRIHVESGSSLRIENSFVNEPGSFGLRVIGTGTLILDADNSTGLPSRNLRLGSNSAAGPVVQIGHNNALGTGTVFFESFSLSRLQSKDAGARTIANPISIGSTIAALGAAGTGDLTFTSPITLTANAGLNIQNTVTFSNSISQDVAGRTLTKSGAGKLVLIAASSYTGGTSFAAGEAGVISISHSSALGTGSVTMNDGSAKSQLELSGGITLTQSVRVSSGGLGAGDERTGALKSSGGDNVLANFGFGNTTPGTRMNVESGSLTIQNNITTDVGNNGFRVIGAGTLVLSGDNSAGLGSGREFRIGSNLAQGPTILAGHDKSLGLGMIAFSPNSNSTLRSKDATDRTFTNSLLLGDSTTTLGATSTGDITFTGPVVLGGAVDVNENISDLPEITEVRLVIHNTVNLDGAITEAAAGKAFSKSGPGKLVLGGINTYSGATTVDQGELILNGTLDASQVTVESGGTLGGNGTVGLDATVAANGVLSPGDASSAMLSFGSNLALAEDSTYAVGITGATSHDTVNVTGTMTIDGLIAVTLDGYAPVSGDEFQVVAAASITGTPGFDFTAAALVGGLIWDTSSFTTDGKIKVIASGDDYGAWVAESSFEIGDDTTPAGDPDRDGTNNLQEHAFGLDPKDPASLNPITQMLAKQSGTFTYTRRATSGLTYKVWTSTDLADWTPDTTASQSATAIPATSNESVLVTLTAPPTGPMVFVRVSAE